MCRSSISTKEIKEKGKRKKDERDISFSFLHHTGVAFGVAKRKQKEDKLEDIVELHRFQHMKFLFLFRKREKERIV